MNQSKERVSIYTAKPVTPKSLMLLSSGQVVQTPPHRFRMMQIGEQNQKKPLELPVKKAISPLPGFMEEYMQNEIKVKVERASSHQTGQRVQTTKPQSRKKNESFQYRAQTSPNNAVRTEAKVFRIYKPQIIEISPRSKMRIYSTINLSNTGPMKKIGKFNFSLNHTLKPPVHNSKHEESSQIVTENAEYMKPAMTFGEKLWRLNEVSIFSMLDN